MRMKKEKRVRTTCCDKDGVKKGTWTPEEDQILVDYINKNGHGTWHSLPKLAGLLRCGKSCRLRWKNYLRPDIKRGDFTIEEEQLIINLHTILGNKWTAIASNLPGRTDNEIKNIWKTRLKKRFPSTDLNIVTSAGPSMYQSALPQSPSQLASKSTDTKSESAKTECNYYLQMWNSEVGNSFRKNNRHGVESGSGITTQVVPTHIFTSADASDEQNSKEYADYSNSFETEGSSDSILNLLLDFPNGGEIMEFLKQRRDSAVSSKSEFGSLSVS